MLLATCHCGAIEIRVADEVTTVTECNCTVSRRYGVLWAYFAPDKVAVVARRPQQVYAWGEKTQGFYRCADCGCITHWAKFDPKAEWMGINARLFEPDILATARLRRLDGENSFAYLDE